MEAIPSSEVKVTKISTVEQRPAIAAVKTEPLISRAAEIPKAEIRKPPVYDLYAKEIHTGERPAEEYQEAQKNIAKRDTGIAFRNFQAQLLRSRVFGLGVAAAGAMGAIAIGWWALNQAAKEAGSIWASLDPTTKMIILLIIGIIVFVVLYYLWMRWSKR